MDAAWQLPNCLLKGFLLQNGQSIRFDAQGDLTLLVTVQVGADPYTFDHLVALGKKLPRRLTNQFHFFRCQPGALLSVMPLQAPGV
ncbi:MAG: hypothetical protein ACREH5_02000, partial [Candidatus Omnitrophota bacterium]